MLAKKRAFWGQLILIPLFILLFSGYFFLIGNYFKSTLSNASYSFGYLDFQNNWRSLEDFIRLKTPFKDYYFEYGWFFLFLQAPAYLFFGRNFLALLISEFLYLPLMGIFLSYILALNILRKKILVFIFLFLALPFSTNFGSNSTRHLVAELGLSFYILFLLKKDRRYLLISGIVSGLAVITALEYGLCLNITIFICFILNYFSKLNFGKLSFKKFIGGELIILFPFFFWLFIKGALTNFLEFTIGYTKNFYYSSPCVGGFPRLPEIVDLSKTSKLSFFNFPLSLAFFQKLNFYFVFIFLVISAIVIFIKFLINRKFSVSNLVKLSLIIYGLLIFVRTLDTPCLGYFSYGLVPFLILVTFLIEEIIHWSWQKKTLFFKVIGILALLEIFFWFILTETSGTVIKIFEEKPETIEKEFQSEESYQLYQPAGWFIRKDLVEKYNEIEKFIKENTNENDFLYVYPWGPYTQIIPINSAISFNYPGQYYAAGDRFINLVLNELKIRKPKFVIVNLYNNSGIATFGKTRKDVPRYFSLESEDGPVFFGDGSIEEKYILENYQPVFKNDLAVVMKQRSKPIKIERENNEVYRWEPGKKGEKTLWNLAFENPILASDITVELKLKGNFLIKHLTRYYLNIYVLPEKGFDNEPYDTQIIATRTWQTVKIIFPKPKQVKTLKIEIGDDIGLIWWLKPKNLMIRKVTFYYRN